MSTRHNGALFIPASTDRKLSPVRQSVSKKDGRTRGLPGKVKCSATYASIESTCPSSCAFKGAGCYITSGLSKFWAKRLDLAVGDPETVALSEAALIRQEAEVGVPQDGARGGRDLRLHVGGDVLNEASAEVLGAAAAKWRAGGGGSVWTYTHRWRDVPRAFWGPNVFPLASVETVDEAHEAMNMGYVPAIVVDRFHSDRTYQLGDPDDSLPVVPCPYETRGRTCVECRLCLDHEDHLRASGVAIGFAIHGPQKKAGLAQIRSKTEARI